MGIMCRVFEKLTNSAVVEGDEINEIANSSNEMTDAYVSSTYICRINAELDNHSKGSRKVNLIPENPSESSERQQADKKGLKASLPAVKAGSNPSTLSSLDKNHVDMDDDLERDYRYKINAAETEV